MKTFVTGGTGLIGSALIRQLLERGDAIKALVRSDSNVRRIHGLDMQVVEGDIRDEEMLRSAASKVASRDFLGAASALSEVEAMGPDRLESSGLLASIHAVRESVQAAEQEAAELYRKAVDAYESGNNEEARRLLGQLRDRYGKTRFFVEH